ncbi:4169_t:CDS:2 [Ambispora gerdemannii]|uniref:4169_t:CDS:1 n=1 Tax=Ambispora gerdemannii TaxID=144530 RepID=A0A9N9AIT2_9GLOM|nr:4169_t:CDS:2 [Ambispora gerdemannii]
MCLLRNPSMYRYTNPGSQNEHLQECILSWHSKHKKFTQIQIFENLKQVARKNHDYACLLGFCYYEGFGTLWNLQESFEWYHISAEHNDAFGQNELGYFYQEGYGTKVDHEKALYWYRKSADNGCSHAKGNLGHCYQDGIHVKRNLRHAFYWYSKSAEMGDESGKCNLATMVIRGKGTNIDVHQALKLYLEAKNVGHTHVEQYFRTIFYSLRYSLP